MSSTTSEGPLTALESVILTDEAPGGGPARVVVAPERGGMVTRFEVRGTPVLFLDEASLSDVTTNVRGGNPVLFPSPGRLTDDIFTRDARAGSMKQHGFARQRPWSVVARSEREVTLELLSADLTRAQFPWDFVARLRYALEGAKLTVETRITNKSDVAMPFALGFHPYFHVPDGEKAASAVVTGATRAFDNVTKTTVEVQGPLDLTQKELDLHLHDHASTSATLRRGDRDRIVVTVDPELARRWVVWTLAGKDFVCLEPWSAPGDALNTGEGLLVLGPGETKTLTMTIGLEREG